MGLFIIVQVLLDLAFLAFGIWVLVERARIRKQEDAKLSRGLQLLTSKTAVIQDLMDRSEILGRQLTQLLDRKQDEIQNKLEQVNVHLHKVQLSIQKSEEVAQIFQDKIPHEQIIERQNSMKYMQAAKLAHQGLSIEEISKQVDIPTGELELIVKLNREKLLVQQEPEWAHLENYEISESSNVVAAPTTAPTIQPISVESTPTPTPIVAQEKNEPLIRPVAFKKISLIDQLGQ